VGQTSEHCLGGWRWGGRAAERPDGFSRLRSEEREARGGRGGDTGQHGGEGRRRVRNSNNKKIETARGNTQNDEGQYTNSRRIRTFGNATTNRLRCRNTAQSQRQQWVLFRLFLASIGRAGRGVEGRGGIGHGGRNSRLLAEHITEAEGRRGGGKTGMGTKTTE